MLKLEEWMDIKSLSRQGHSIKAIARMTGYSRNTIRRALREESPAAFRSPPRRSVLDPYKAYVQGRYEECELSAVRLHEEIVPMGYQGGVDTIRRFVRTIRRERQGRQKMTVRFETPPGKQAQVDWASCGRIPNASGQLVPVYAFVLVLAFSRMLFVRFTTSMKLPELIRCHLEAFRYLGGWPAELLFDNMAQVRQRSGDLHPLFADFAAHYGIAVKTHRVRRPRTKGKVERQVHYLKDNFLNGRAFADLDDLNGQARHWLDCTANTRVHATTNRRPIDLLGAEGLAPIATACPYRIYAPASRTVDWEGFVQFTRSRYSVPARFAGSRVEIGQQDHRVLIHSNGELIAEHPVAQRPGQCIAAEQHVQEMWRLSLASKPLVGVVEVNWRARATAEVQERTLATYDEVAS